MATGGITSHDLFCPPVSMVKDAMEPIYTAVYLTFNAGCHATLSYIAFDPLTEKLFSLEVTFSPSMH